MPRAILSYCSTCGELGHLMGDCEQTAPELRAPLTQVERNRRWRAKNRGKYNASQRKLMRERRARKE